MEPISEAEQAEIEKTEKHGCSCCTKEHCTSAIELLHKIVDGIMTHIHKKEAQKNSALNETLDKSETKESLTKTEIITETPADSINDIPSDA